MNTKLNRGRVRYANRPIHLTEAELTWKEQTVLAALRFHTMPPHESGAKPYNRKPGKPGRYLRGLSLSRLEDAVCADFRPTRTDHIRNHLRALIAGRFIRQVAEGLYIAVR